MSGVHYRADLLLEAMRPAVNDVLAEVDKLMPGIIPTCPSMSQKAIVAIRAIDKFVLTPEPLSSVVQSLEQRVRLRSLSNKLEEFMAVWHTVNIMEHPDNHTWFQPEKEVDHEV